MDDCGLNQSEQEIRWMISVGLDAARRGELLDGEEVMANLLRRHEDRAREVGLEL